MTAATKKAPARKPAEKSSLDYLQSALDDLGHAREMARQEARSWIDSAAARVREARKEIGGRAQDQAEELQSRLEHASDEALREFGRAAVLAQRSPEALTEMQAEIRARKRMLLA